MTRVANLPDVTCAVHRSSFLLDVVEPDGAIVHLCTICQSEAGDPLVQIDVVRQLHKRTSQLAEGKDTGT